MKTAFVIFAVFAAVGTTANAISPTVHTAPTSKLCVHVSPYERGSASSQVYCGVSAVAWCEDIAKDTVFGIGDDSHTVAVVPAPYTADCERVGFYGGTP